VGLVVGIDRMMSEARAVTNFTGNAVATVLVASWTGEFDKGRAERVLSGQDKFDEVAFAAGDDHGGGVWDDELADLTPEVSATSPALAPIGH
jgi:aerobic C4-dicarboxylate transport protein